MVIRIDIYIYIPYICIYIDGYKDGYRSDFCFHLSRCVRRHARFCTSDSSHHFLAPIHLQPSNLHFPLLKPAPGLPFQCYLIEYPTSGKSVQTPWLDTTTIMSIPPSSSPELWYQPYELSHSMWFPPDQNLISRTQWMQNLLSNKLRFMK